MSDDERLWYKDAVFYELRIRSFYDSNGDGIGDLRGLTEKLDYLQDLGVTTLWLLPFYPSPPRDDGYDTADYTDVHPECGTLRDFRTFLREAHRRGLRVVTELVLNHTSDQHPWFQRARRAAPGDRYRDFYVWSDSPERYADARIIFKDFEHSNWSWDPVARAYYWHRFFSNQPDLNFDNPEVRRTVLQMVDFWLEMGVDGLRLDAVPYLFEREGTSCENLAETHAFLKDLRAHVESKFPNRMLLAEANQWPEDAVAYFGAGDECQTAFHFPIMPRLFMAIEMEDRHPIVDILDQTPSIPESCQWVMFLRNHDELTLEMVTDEERDYMVRAYASDPRARINLGIRRRLAPLLGNDRRKMELMSALLFSLPGTPVIYYGDEIGMGDNMYLGDRNGVRTPMQWSPDRNAGFSSANPQRLVLPLVMDPEYHYEAINVETMQANPNSLLWWTKRIVDLRKQHLAFGRGTLTPLVPSNRKVLAFYRRYGGDVLLVVANLSRFSQYVELDLREYSGRVPRELFGHIEFPRIGDLPYLLTLGPYSFYWFSITQPEAERIDVATAPPRIEVTGDWERVFDGNARDRLEAVLPDYLQRRRWFRSKARRITQATVVDTIELCAELRLVLVQVEFLEGEDETYVLPLAFAKEGSTLSPVLAGLGVRRRDGEEEGVLIDAADEPELAQGLLALVRRKRKLKGARFEVRGVASALLRRTLDAEEHLEARGLRREQSNSSWMLGDRFVLKLFRRVEEGANPELEISRRLAGGPFSNVPQLAGHAEIVSTGSEPGTLAIIHTLVPNEGDAWSFTLDELERYFERLLASRSSAAEVTEAGLNPIERAACDAPPQVVAHVAGYLDVARLLGARTAELHLALAAHVDDPVFAPEPFTPFSRRSLYQSLRNLTMRVFDLLAARRDQLADGARVLADDVLARRSAVLERFGLLLGDRRLLSRRIRCHGDYHLGQVLYTGGDFVIIDFEGEPARPLGERRLKRSPLADVAGMIRSFDYAVENVLSGQTEGSILRREDVPFLRPWGALWARWVSAAYLKGYLDTAVVGGLLPEDRDELAMLLDIHLVEKALYEVAYELNNRPDWVAIPLRGITDALGPGAGSGSAP